MDLDALLAEWFTGRAADGTESVRFAKRWRDDHAGGFPSRVYTPHLHDLGPQVGKLLAAHRVGVTVPVGSDGAAELRIEHEITPGALVVERWRPATGDLGTAVDHSGTRCNARESLTRLRDAALAVAALDPATLNRAQLHTALGRVKAYRAALLQQREALVAASQPTTTVDNRIASAETKLAELRTAFADRKAAEWQVEV